jgi:micrococcal nuclease
MSLLNNYLYHYRAHVTKVYDGDTVTADIDLGFGVILKKQKIRLSGIDTPEVRGESREEGIKVRDAVRKMILDKDITLKTIKDKSGKYGRWLGEIYLDDRTASLNQILLSEGMAVEYMK